MAITIAITMAITITMKITTIAITITKTITTINPMHTWQQFKYSFVYMQIIPTSLILGKIFF